MLIKPQEYLSVSVYNTSSPGFLYKSLISVFPNHCIQTKYMVVWVTIKKCKFIYPISEFSSIPEIWCFSILIMWAVNQEQIVVTSFSQVLGKTFFSDEYLQGLNNLIVALVCSVACWSNNRNNILLNRKMIVSGMYFSVAIQTVCVKGGRCMFFFPLKLIIHFWILEYIYDLILGFAMTVFIEIESVISL